MEDNKNRGGQTRPVNPQGVQQIVGSIVTDTSYNNQPDGTTRFVLNGVYNSKEGDIGFISNEIGFETITTIPDNYVVTGSISLLNNELIIFLAPILTSLPSRIVKQTAEGILEDLVVDINLTFKTDKYIKGKWRLLNLCETVIYFVDGDNVDRAININRLEDYTVGNVDNITANSDPLFQGWETGLFNLEQEYLHPTINLNRVIPTGGRCKLGTYHFAIQYVNATQDVSNYISFSAGVNVSQLNQTYDLIQGGDPLFTQVRASIDLSITNLDTRYESFNLIAVETTEGISQPFKVGTFRTANSFNHIFRGITEDSIPLSLIDIAIDKVPYKSSESIEIHGKRLFRANLKEKDIKWGKFQQRANSIQTRYFTRAVKHKDTSNYYSGYSDPKLVFDNRSYMRDEIYALGIVWIFKDGSTSPAFHIPGRDAGYIVGGLNRDGISIIFEDIVKNTTTNRTQTLHNRYPLEDNTPFFSPSFNPTLWDKLDLNHSSMLLTNGSSFGGLKNDKNSFANVEERWQVYNTALQEFNVLNDTNSPENPSNTAPDYTPVLQFLNAGNDLNTRTFNRFSRGYLAYWESEFEYPNTECDGDRVFPEGKIKHHKMPDTTLEKHFINVVGQEYILPLGLEFHNIQPPVEYANEVQGYYIVRSQRTLDNKTILDKGIIYHNVAHFYQFQDESNEVATNVLLNTRSAASGTNFVFSDSFNAETYSFHTQTCAGNRHWWSINPSTSLETSPNNLYSAFFTSSDYLPNTKLGTLFGVNNGLIMPMNFSEGASTSADDAEQIIDLYNVTMHSPKAKFEGFPLGTQYLKAEGVLKGEWGGSGGRGVFVIRRKGTGNKDTKRMSHHTISYNDWLPIDYKTTLNKQNRCLINTNYSINEERLIQPHQSIALNDTTKYVRDGVDYETNQFFMNRQQQDGLILSLKRDNPLPYLDDYSQWNILNVRDADAGDGLSFYHTSLLNPPFGYPSLNDAERNNSICIYASAKVENPTIYNNIEDVVYIPISSKLSNYAPAFNPANPTITGVRLFEGDVFISKCAVLRNYVNYNMEETQMENLWKDIPYYFVESEINTELRHEKLDENLIDVAAFSPERTFFPLRNEYDFLRNWDFIRWTTTDWDNADYDQVDDVIEEYVNNNYVKNFYAYNRDYSQGNEFKLFLPISNRKMYCGGCINQYPHRVAYSILGEQEQSVDYFRNFLANDYKDINSNFGPITNIFEYRDNLFAHTTQGIFIQQTRPMELNTNNLDSIFVGIGDVLALPEKGLNNTDNGYAGSQHKGATVVTEHGVIFPSAVNGQIFKLDGEGLKELTLDGNANWGRESIPLNFLSQYKKVTGEVYPHQATSDNKSIGYISTYDSRNKRVILTKKDYKIINESTFNKDDFDLQNPTQFENLSWTVSINSMDNGIKSFHSYLPNFIYNSTSKWFSFIAGNTDIREHNIGDRLEPFIVETVDKFMSIHTFSSSVLNFIATSYRYDDNYKDYVIDHNDTFNKAVMYNNHQSTGLLNLEVYNQPFQTPTNNQSILIKKTEQIWKLNGFRNNVVDETIPLFTKNWNDLQSDYFIDKLPNNDAIDYNKGLFSKDKLRDTFLVKRLIYTGNNKIVYKFNLDKSKISFR